MKNLYIHIPFCKRKCSFCDFSIYAVGKNDKSDFNKDIYSKYINAIKNEISFIFTNFKSKFTNIETIYFGGGTPTLINPTHLEIILNEIKKHTTFSNNIEISLESDPNTFTKDSLTYYKQIGFNRITMGIQSLDRNVQRNLNRSHTIEDVYGSLSLIQNSSFVNNYGVDLIQGLPKQSIKSVMDDLRVLAGEYKVPHLSVYMLSLEKNSALYNRYNKEYSSALKQDELADMYIATHNYLKERSYDHYEVSNYCLSDKSSKHNIAYWDGFSQYYGFGLSSSSNFSNKRFAKPKSVVKYLDFIEKLNLDNFYEFVEKNNDMSEKINDDNNEVRKLKYLLLNQIRRKEGINLREVYLNFDRIYFQRIKMFFEQLKYKNLFEFQSDNDKESVRMIFPEGILLSDEILVDLFIYIFDKLK
jgi:oxygen-independent coproporphyrinogen-3 oxidase